MTKYDKSCKIGTVMITKTRNKVALLGLSLATTYGLACVTYAVSDGKSLSDAMWWGFITFTTVGYGDQYPTSLVGRLAGALLVLTSVFVVIPTITALIVTRIVGNKDEFTHEEQEEVKTLLRAIHQTTVAERKKVA